MNLVRRPLPIALCGLLVLLLAGCQAVDTALPAGNTGQGQFSVMIHDDPAPGLEQAYVTFSSLELHEMNGDWMLVNGSYPLELDLLALVNGVEAELADGMLPAGEYDGMRATITAARVVFDDGTEVPVPVPVGGLPVEVTGMPIINIGLDDASTATLDFPVGDSFTIVGTTVQFTPVIYFESES